MEVSPEYSFKWLMLKFQYFGHLIWRIDSLKKTEAEKDWRQEEKGMTEDEMIGCHHWLNGHEFEQSPGVGDGQGSLACWSPWCHKESDTTERLLNWMFMMTQNRCTTWELWVKFYLGHSEGCSPGGSISYSSERLLQSSSSGGLVAKSCLTLATLWTVARQAPLSMGFSRQGYWSGLPFPSLGDLPNAGIESRSALQADSLPTELWGKPKAAVVKVNM